MGSQRVGHAWMTELNWTELLYNIVVVLPHIDMNPPWVYMCSPSKTSLPPPSPSHPSGLSQCTSPEHPISGIKPRLAIRFSIHSYGKFFLLVSTQLTSTINARCGLYPWFSHKDPSLVSFFPYFLLSFEGLFICRFILVNFLLCPFLFGYSCFTLLCRFLLYSKANQPYVYI